MKITMIQARKMAGLALLMGLVAGGAGCGSKDPASAPTQQQPPVSREPSNVVAPPSRPAGFTQVTDAYGPLVVKASEFTAEAKKKPWSSWWYPVRDTYLFKGENGNLSPLEKYDRYNGIEHGQASTSVQAEQQNSDLYNPDGASWEGRCNAWAIASIMEPEPDHPVTRDGLLFGVGDQKALLVKTYEKVTGLRYFGQRYDGTRDSNFDDIYPDQFHKLLQAELFEKGKPFIMDKDPGIAVWNTPVWKAETHLVPDNKDAHVMHVTTWLFGASPFVDSYDYVGTEQVVFQYTYDLHGDAQSDGSFKVDSGAWTGDSLNYHPDFLTATPDDGSLQHQSENPQVTNDIVKEIVGH